MEVAGYIRVSTDEQAEKGNSLDEQRERLEAYCKAMGWSEPYIYEDDGYSAKDLRRPELTRLLDDVKTKKYDMIITTKLDRLSRRLFDILSVIEYLDKYNCNYASASEPFDTTSSAGRMTLQMLGMVAEFERERNSERVRDNMRAIARKGDRVITRPCFGYDVKNGTMVVNVEESLHVKRMAQWALEGHGAREIAKRLNDMGVKTKSGNQWHNRIVRDLLQRETLIGEIVYNRTYKKGTRTLTRPEEEWIRIKDHHEPILDEKDFYTIQKIFNARKTAGRHIDQSRYLLSGLVRCGHCGSKMNGKAERKKGDREPRWFRYTCDGYIKRGVCFHHSVRRDQIENIIVNRIKDVATSAPGTLKLHVVKSQPAQRDEKSIIENRLKKLDQKMQRQIEAYEDDLISASDLRKARDRVDKEREQLQKALNAAQTKKNDPKDINVHSNAKKLLQDVTGVDRLKAKHAIRQLVNEIEITNGEQVKITWNDG